MKEQTASLLACPHCHHALQHDKHHDRFICQHDQCYYPIVDGIPALLPETAKPLEEKKEKHHEI